MDDLRDAARPPHRVAVLLVPTVIGFDATIPAMVFGESLDADGRPLYEVSMCALGDEPVSTGRGYRLAPEADLGVLEEADTVVIPGTVDAAARYRGELSAETAEALGRIRPGARLASLCTGAFVLAAAGVLDGRRATTHWRHAAAFRELFPAVALDESALFVDEGDVLTSAGLTAGIDLCLHMVRQDAGWEVANRAARYCVAPSWRDGDQSQYIDLAPPADSRGATLAPSRDWALRRLHTEITVPQWAAHAHMSERTFTRRFRVETGRSPASWLVRQRIRRAQQMLESTDLPVDVVAVESGFGTGAALRKQFRGILGTTPSEHRRRFGSSADVVAAAG